MADAYIQVALDGPGKKMQTVENTVSGNSVHAEAVLLVNGAGVPLATIPVSGPLTDAELRASPVPVSGSFSFPTGAATEAKQDTQITDLGGITETAPASDTASSGLNGRLQRIAQRLTSLIALLPANIGQKAKAASLAVALPTDQVGTALIPSADILSVQRPSITEVRSTAFEASRVLKASAGQLVQLSVFNSGLAQFILLINATTLPANGAVTLLFPPIPIAKETLLVLDLPAPLVASTGIVVCNSSTGSFTKTLGAADLAIYAQVN